MAREVGTQTDSYDRYVEFVEKLGLAVKEITVIAEGDSLPSDASVANPSLGNGFINEPRSLMLAHQDALLDVIAIPSSDLTQVVEAPTGPVETYVLCSTKPLTN